MPHKFFAFNEMQSSESPKKIWFSTSFCVPFRFLWYFWSLSVFRNSLFVGYLFLLPHFYPVRLTRFQVFFSKFLMFIWNKLFLLISLYIYSLWIQCKYCCFIYLCKAHRCAAYEPNGKPIFQVETYTINDKWISLDDIW